MIYENSIIENFTNRIFTPLVATDSEQIRMSHKGIIP